MQPYEPVIPISLNKATKDTYYHQTTQYADFVQIINYMLQTDMTRKNSTTSTGKSMNSYNALLKMSIRLCQSWNSLSVPSSWKCYWMEKKYFFKSIILDIIARMLRILIIDKVREPLCCNCGRQCLTRDAFLKYYLLLVPPWISSSILDLSHREDTTLLSLCFVVY